MPGHRGYGMDHKVYDWSPIPFRERLTWPNDARVAVCVIVNLEHYEWNPPFASYVSRLPHPDIRNFSQREYGNRVGIFRIMSLLDAYGIRATVALDATIAENYPYLVEQCLRRDWEFLGHGLSANAYITSDMTEQEERRYVQKSLNAVEMATGQRPVGWLGPGFSESLRTPEILAREEILYVCDWPNDEQPYPMTTSYSNMYSLPITGELDDYTVLVERQAPVMRYSQLIRETFDVMYQEGGDNGRLLVLNLHPWLIGQPFRIKYLRQALEYLAKSPQTWNATGKEIVDWYRAHQ